MPMADAARSPRYDNEDVSPTSDRELRGWYSTGLAAEIYAVCGVGSFAPVTLEQLAREAGVRRSDGVSPCLMIKPKGESTARRLAKTVARAANTSNDDLSNQCVVRPFGRPIATQSFAMYTFSLAVLLQALVLISFSPVADYGLYRKRLMMAFAFTGAFLTMSMVFVWPKVYLLASLFTIIGVVCLGSTFVLLNSFLPLLAANHSSVSQSQTQINGHASGSRSDKISPQLKLSTQISSKGVGLGYAAAVSVQILCIILLVLLKKANFASESTPLRCVLLLVGACWSLLTLPGSLWLRHRPGPSLRVVRPWESRLPAVVQYLVFAWSSVWKTVKTAAKLRQVWVFLIAWFLLSDAIATVSGTAILFARTELDMSTIAIALLSITATLSGIAGAFTWPLISRRLKLQTKHTIIGCMIIMEIIPLYGLLGFVPFIKSWGVLGLQQAWEIYPLGFVHGFVMGGLSSYCRSFYGEIIPPGSEAAFYALYAITDKGSSAVGPAIVGAIVDAVGTIRPAFGFLAILILLPMPLVYFVDVQKGRAEAVAMSNYIGSTTGAITMQEYDDDHETDAGEGLLRQQPDDDDEGDIE